MGLSHTWCTPCVSLALGAISTFLRRFRWRVPASRKTWASLKLCKPTLPWCRSVNCYTREPEQAGLHGLPLLADTKQQEQHAQQEAARFQLTFERRERNKVAQAAYRQRKRVKAASEKQDMQRAADRIASLEHQISDLRSGKVTAAQLASTAALRTEFTTLQSGYTTFQGLLTDLRRVQHDGASQPAVSSQPASFAVMCELNELRELPHHSRRLARRHCLQSLHMHPGWEEALPLNLKSLYDALLSGDLDVTMRLEHRHSNLSITLRKLLRMSGADIQAMMAEPIACMAFAFRLQLA
ncbi:hypothetical protein WJX74_009155 [Apatococcus lobatus]|uniref:BZIP domain-containing protein n=1 Tax=Apatococcus lobatus TaxID=904363 RepID=A0AAW1RJJ5_9CHLO